MIRQPEEDSESRKTTTKMPRVVVPRRAPDREIDAVEEALASAPPLPAVDNDEAPETLDRCPACACCTVCRGTGAVDAKQKAAFHRGHDGHTKQ